MAKALKTAGIILAVGALAVVTGGAAVGLGISLATSFAGISASALLLASAGLQLASSLLAPRPKAPAASAANADRLTVSIDARTPRKILFGYTALATDLRDQEYSDDQTYLHRFIVVASHKINDAIAIWFDDKIAWSQTGGVTAEFAGYLDVQIVTEGSADTAIDIGPRMGSSRRYTGCAYVYIRYRLKGLTKDKDSPFASSIPSRMTIRGRGAWVCDPRAGQSPTDQTTWAWHDQAARNPALQLLWYLLGWKIRNPETGAWKLAVGKGIPAARIDIASFITAANLCDEPVLKKDGTYEPRYQSDGIFSEGDDPSLVLDALKSTMNAVLDDIDGRIRLTVLHNDLATPAGSLSEADVEGAFRWDQTPALNDTFNVIRGSFTDASDTALYQQNEYPEVRIPSPDGIDRVETINYPLVQSVSQAQRLSKQRLQRMLYSGTFSATFLSTAWKFQKGDVIRFTFRPLGWANVLMRIVDTGVQVDGLVPMVLRVEHPAIYAWDRGEEGAVAEVEPTRYDLAEDPWRRRLALLANAVERGLYDPAATYVAGNVVSLDDGSRWLFVDDMPTAGSAPSDDNPHWSRLQGAIVAVDDAGTPLVDLIEDVADDVVKVADALKLSQQDTAAVVADGSLTADKKPLIAKELQFAEDRRAELAARATPLGVPTTEVDADLAAFKAYVTGLPNWSSPTATTPVDPAVYNDLRTKLFASFAALVSGISARIALGSRVTEEMVPGNSTIEVIGDVIRRTGTAAGYQTVYSKRSTKGMTTAKARVLASSTLPVVVGLSKLAGGGTASIASILAGFRVYFDGQGKRRAAIIVNGAEVGDWNNGETFSGDVNLALNYTEADGVGRVMHQAGGGVPTTQQLQTTTIGQELVYKALLVGGSEIANVIFNYQEGIPFLAVVDGPPANATNGSNTVGGTYSTNAPVIKTPASFPAGRVRRMVNGSIVYLDGKGDLADTVAADSPYEYVRVHYRRGSAAGVAQLVYVWLTAAGEQVGAPSALDLLDAAKPVEGDAEATFKRPDGAVKIKRFMTASLTGGYIDVSEPFAEDRAYAAIDNAAVVQDVAASVPVVVNLLSNGNLSIPNAAETFPRGIKSYSTAGFAVAPVVNRDIGLAFIAAKKGLKVTWNEEPDGTGQDVLRVILPAFAVARGDRISLSIDGDFATIPGENATYPLRISINELDADLPAGKTHVAGTAIDAQTAVRTRGLAIDDVYVGEPLDLAFIPAGGADLRWASIEIALWGVTSFTAREIRVTKGNIASGVGVVDLTQMVAAQAPSGYDFSGYFADGATQEQVKTGAALGLPAPASPDGQYLVTTIKTRAPVTGGGEATVLRQVVFAAGTNFFRTSLIGADSWGAWATGFSNSFLPATTNITNQAGTPQSDATLITAQGEAGSALSVNGAGPFLFAADLTEAAPVEAAKLRGVSDGAGAAIDFYDHQAAFLRSGNAFVRATAGTGWDYVNLYVVPPIGGSCRLSARDFHGQAIVGLTTQPTPLDSIEAIDFAIYVDTDPGSAGYAVQVVESGTVVRTFALPPTGAFDIEYDRVQVRYRRNGQAFYVSQRPIASDWRIQAALNSYTQGSGAGGVRFEPYNDGRFETLGSAGLTQAQLETSKGNAAAALTVLNAGGFLFAATLADGDPVAGNKLAGMEEGSDVTSKNFPLIEDVAPVTIALYPDGSPVPNQFPIERKLTLMVGGVDKSAEGQWSLTKPAAIEATVETAAPNSTRGTLRIMSPVAGRVTVVVIFRGALIRRDVDITTTYVAAPPAQVPTSFSTSTYSAALTAGSAVFPLTEWIAIRVSSSGALIVSGNVGYSVSDYGAVTPLYNFTRARVFLAYSASSAGTDPVVFATAENNANSAAYNYFDGQAQQQRSGVVSVEAALTGLSNGSTIYLQLSVQLFGQNDQYSKSGYASGGNLSANPT